LLSEGDALVKYSMVVTASVMVTVGALSGCMGRLPTNEAGSTATAPPLEEGRSVASYFRAGDCIEEISPSATAVTLVDCTEPHAAEVYAVFALPDGPFPGDARIQEYQDRCSGAALAEYSSAAANDPSIDTVRRSPDQASWDIGDRSVTCIVTFDPPRRGSVRQP
jgi:hypothetical protein